MNSLAVVEDTIKLRYQIKSTYQLVGCIKDFTTPIVYGGKNYLMEMKTDTQFLYKSRLAQMFNFSNKPDPFLLTAATPYPISKGASK
jgi:hypothetical protein